MKFNKMKFNKTPLTLNNVHFADGSVGTLYIEQGHAVCDDYGYIQAMTLSTTTGEINLTLQPDNSTRSQIVNFLEAFAAPLGLLYLGNKMFQGKADGSKKQVSMLVPFMYNQQANGLINPIFQWVRARDSSYFDLSTRELVIENAIQVSKEYLT